MAEVGGSWFSQVWCCWVLLVIGDRQCLGLMLLGFWVAQIGDGFGGDWRGHGKVVRGGDGGGFRWPSPPRNLTPHRSEFLGCGLILWVYGVGLWLILDCGLWMVLMVSFRW